MAARRNKLAAALATALAVGFLAGGAPLVGCSSVLGADFDRPEDDDALGDGGSGGEGGTGDGGGASSDGSHTAADSGEHDGGGVDGSSPPGDDDDDDTGPEAGTDASLDSGAHTDASGDSGHVVDCSTKTSPGKDDLVVTELMIETTDSEIDDPGQWLEITNVSGCTLPLAGLVISSPNSFQSNDNEVDISASDTTTVPNGGTFVVADVTAPPDITGIIYSFQGTGTLESGDDSVTISLNGTEISTLEFQWFDCQSNEQQCFHKGHSIELPPGCKSAVAADNWLESNHMYGMNAAGLTLYGTPNAPNGDQTSCAP